MPWQGGFGLHSSVLRSLLFVALVACSSSTGLPDAPSSAWSQGPTMPRRALEPAVAALGQQLVMVGGFETSASEGLGITAQVDALDTTTGTWGALPEVPVRWTHGNVAVLGATLYLVGGLEGTELVARGDGFALDPLEHTWQPIAAMEPGDARGAAGVAKAPGRIYLLGGASSTEALASCLEYDVAADRWTRLPDLPAPRVRPAAMRRQDGTLIVAGGLATLDSSQPRGEVWALPPPGAAPRAWKAVSSMPIATGGCAYAVVLGQLVCAGGEAGLAASAAVQSYDPYLDVWTTGEAMPVARAGTQGAAIGGRLYVPGGSETLAFTPTDTLYLYAPFDTAPR